jgi:hypothetical protein
MTKGIYSSSEASKLTIQNFANRLISDKGLSPEYKEAGAKLLTSIKEEADIYETFRILKEIASIAETYKDEEFARIRRVALALSYSEEKEEDFASKEDLEWIPRVKDGLTSYGLESMEYQITEDASSFQEAWIFPGRRIELSDLGVLLIGVDYDLEPRTAKPIPADSVALSVFFERIVSDSKGTASKHILPLYLIIVKNTRLAVILGLLRLRLRVGFTNLEDKLTKRFDYIKNTKA